MGWVLVVDDDTVAAESLVIQLQSRRIRADRARSADEALTTLRSAPVAPIAIVIEPMMEDGSATRLLEMLDADPVLRHARALILTRAHNPVILGRATMIFHKATDSDRLLMVVEALAKNHGVQGNIGLSAVPARALIPDAELRTVNAGNVRMAISLTSEAVVEVSLTGRSDARDPTPVLRPHFDQIVADAVRLRRGLRVAFERLDYFNSSSLAFLIQLIHLCRDKGVSLQISYAESLKWQSVSFDALKRAMKVFERDDSAPVTFVGLQLPEQLAPTAS